MVDHHRYPGGPAKHREPLQEIVEGRSIPWLRDFAPREGARAAQTPRKDHPIEGRDKDMRTQSAFDLAHIDTLGKECPTRQLDVMRVRQGHHHHLISFILSWSKKPLQKLAQL